MLKQLQEFIDRTGNLPFEWGERCCAIWVADWCVIRFGHDPAADHRGTFNSAKQSAHRYKGRLVQLFDECLEVDRKDAAEIGDVGIVVLQGREVGAIFTGSHWAIKTKNAVALLQIEPIAIWGVTDGT